VPDPVVIDDPADARLDDYRSLRDPARRGELEAQRGVLVAEGTVPIRTLLRSGRRVRSLLLVPREHVRLSPELRHVDAPVYLADLALLTEVAGYDVHRGALAAADRFAPAEPEAVLAEARRVLVLEAATNLENIGGAFRNAAAFGFDAVLLDPACGDPLVRRIVRVSSGHVLTLPFARLPALPGGLAPLRAAGFELVALTPAADAEPLAALRPAPGARVALLVGSEGPGLRPATLAAVDRRVRIPLAPEVDSLNLSVAAAIAMHHVSLVHDR
jgi:tRNA G18 (ribose-2'-O)-methylase SpoU